MQPPRLDSPWPWLALAAAVALLVASRRGPATRAWWSGTLFLWRGLARAPRAAQGATRPPPAAAVCAAAALVAGGLALAGPRAGRDVAARTWAVQVDVSPSMFLPWSAPDALASAPAPTRLERALESARTALRERGAGAQDVLWRRAVDGVVEEARGAAPPDAWTSPPRAPQPPPAWTALDLGHVLWVSDDAGGARPVRALACLSGGGAVPGPVAALGRARLEVGPAGELAVSGASAAAPRLRVDPALEGGDLARVLDAWASARGVERVEGPAAELSVELAVSGRAPSGTPWTAAGEGWRATWEPGRVLLAAPRREAAADDPGRFAAAWAELLDAACLPPAGVVATAERAAAGAARTLGGADSAAGPSRAPGDSGPALWGLLAALLGLGALGLAGRA